MKSLSSTESAWKIWALSIPEHPAQACKGHELVKVGGKWNLAVKPAWISLGKAKNFRKKTNWES